MPRYTQHTKSQIDLMILSLMNDGRERTSGDICSSLNIPVQTVGHAMSRLRKSGLVSVDFLYGMKIYKRFAQ